MSDKAKETHPITVELSEPPPEVPVGTAIAFEVRVTCVAGCDLRGMAVKLTTGDGAEIVSMLERGEEGMHESGTIALEAPRHVGEHVWTLACAPHEAGGALHEERTLTIPIRTA